jgi:hypothetical protein
LPRIDPACTSLTDSGILQAPVAPSSGCAGIRRQPPAYRAGWRVGRWGACRAPARMGADEIGPPADATRGSAVVRQHAGRRRHYRAQFGNWTSSGWQGASRSSRPTTSSHRPGRSPTSRPEPDMTTEPAVEGQIRRAQIRVRGAAARTGVCAAIDVYPSCVERQPCVSSYRATIGRICGVDEAE